MTKIKEVLCYDTIYHFSFPSDGLRRILNDFEFGKKLEERERYITMALYMEQARKFAHAERLLEAGHRPDDLGSLIEHHLGNAYVEIQGVHKRGPHALFLLGRFRRDKEQILYEVPTDDIWSKGYFHGTVDLFSRGHMGTLITGESSFFKNPLREYEASSKSSFFPRDKEGES